jgi:bZIP transcription factor
MENGKGSHLCDEERKERRRAANRKSARKSRFRESILLDELQKTVSQLSKQNDDLRADNDAFKRELILLRSLIEMNQLSMVKCIKFCLPTVNS